MKKALAILSALALVATAATAEVKVGGWGRIGFVPLSGTDAKKADGSNSDVSAYTAPSWADGARVGVNFSGSSDNVGFNLNIDSNGNTTAVGDQAKIWVKLNDVFKFEVGKIQGDVLRGKVGDFGVYSAQLTGDQDGIFKRFNPSAGFLANITPVEGVYIGAALDTAAKGASVTSENMFRSGQYGAGYTIANVGLVRAQYLGTTSKDSSGNYEIGQIVAAFNLTAVQNLNLDVAAAINAKTGGTQSVIAGATFKASDALSVGARVKGTFASSSTTVSSIKTETTSIGVALDANGEYAVSSPVSVGINGSFGYGNASSKVADISASATTTEWQVGPYAKLGYGSGYAAVGFTVSGGNTSTTVSGTTENKAAATKWALPIYAEYWF